MNKLSSYFKPHLMLLLVAGVLSSCHSPKIIITSQYIVIEQPEIPSFKISKILPRDQLKPPVLYTIDSSFQYYILIDSTYQWNHKIYFSREQQGFKWVPANNAKNMATIGNLAVNSWYLIENLHPFKYKYVIQVDNTGGVITYVVNKANF